MRLAGRIGDALGLAGGLGHDGAGAGGRDKALATRQVRGELFGNLLRFFARGLTDDGDAGIVGGVQAVMKFAQVGGRDGVQRVFRGDVAVRRCAVQGAGEGFTGQRARAGAGVFQRLDGAAFFAFDHVGSVGGRGENLRGEFQRGVALGRLGQRAQGEAGAVGVGVGIEQRAGVGQTVGNLLFAQTVRAGG